MIFLLQMVSSQQAVEFRETASLWLLVYGYWLAFDPVLRRNPLGFFLAFPLIFRWFWRFLLWQYTASSYGRRQGETTLLESLETYLLALLLLHWNLFGSYEKPTGYLMG